MTYESAPYDGASASFYLRRKRTTRRRRRLAFGGAMLLLAGGASLVWPPTETEPRMPAESAGVAVPPAKAESLLDELADADDDRGGFERGGVLASPPGLRLTVPPTPAASSPPNAESAAPALPPTPAVSQLAPSVRAADRQTAPEKELPLSGNTAAAAAPAKPPPSRVFAARPSSRAATRPAAASGSSPRTAVYVQLSALSSETTAQREAALLRRSLNSVLRGAPLRVQRAEVRDKPVWRLRAGPFADAAKAETVCADIRRRNGTCLLVGS